MKIKICKECKIEKPITEFHKGNGIYGVRSLCKKCRSKSNPKDISKPGFKKCVRGRIHCNKMKPLEDFQKDNRLLDGRRNQCKKCIKKQENLYYKNNKEKRKSYKKQYYKNNKEIEIEKNRRWQRKNPEKVNKNNKKWRKNNPDYQKNKRKNDPLFRLKESMFHMLKKTFNLINTKKQGRTNIYLGYDPKQLKQRLSVNFTDRMSWDNYGEWWIDHTIPIDHFIKKGITDPKIINALSNLKPRWKTSRIINGKFYLGNIEKGNKLIYK